MVSVFSSLVARCTASAASFSSSSSSSPSSCKHCHRHVFGCRGLIPSSSCGTDVLAPPRPAGRFASPQCGLAQSTSYLRPSRQRTFPTAPRAFPRSDGRSAICSLASSFSSVVSRARRRHDRHCHYRGQCGFQDRLSALVHICVHNFTLHCLPAPASSSLGAHSSIFRRRTAPRMRCCCGAGAATLVFFLVLSRVLFDVHRKSNTAVQRHRFW